VAAMCAESHQYRPLLETEGGGMGSCISPKGPDHLRVYTRLGSLSVYAVSHCCY
jgi:hypothetical protein